MTTAVITGAKGKGGGSGGGVESPNTLRANVKANIVELLGSGEIVGLVTPDGTPVTSDTILQAIILNGTVVQNPGGTLNFKGVTADQRVGLPDQDYILGFNQAETPFEVETQVKFDTGPVVRTISDENVDAVRVVVRLPALAFQDKSSGDLKATSVSYAVEIKEPGGNWVTVETVNINKQKCTSPYPRVTMVDAPTSGAPWDLRVRRITADSTVIELQNETWWESYTEIVMGKFIYPDRALVAMKIDAQQFGESIPTRAYRVRGLKTDVPSNYDPIAREYTGTWDGTFVKAWHNNPVWVFWDLLTHTRYGLGEFIDPSIVDKWSLYQVAQYCDQLVPSGLTDPDGDAIMEPRFTFNTVLNSRSEAFKLLQDVAAAFRGMAYWSLGQAFVSVDMPMDAIAPITPANVIDGAFKYSGTALRARHSVALVSWNDPADLYKSSPELVRDDTALVRFGWRQVEVQPLGCTSRGQARRYGRWILDTEQNETETVEFTMSFDGFIRQNGGTLKPGDIVLIADPRKNGNVRTGGRLRAALSTEELVLDAAYAPITGEDYTITVCLPDGTTEKRDISTFGPDNKTVALATPLSQPAARGAIWLIQGTNLAARRFRILAIQESDTHLFKITALFNDPTKYERVEQNNFLDPIPYVRPSNTISPPTGVTAIESRYFQNGVSHSRVTLSWTQANDFMADHYVVTADTPRGFLEIGSNILSPSADITDAAPGDWVFYITSVSRTGLLSTPTEFAFTVQGWEAVDAPIPDTLQILGGGSIFNGTAATVVWENVFPEDAVLYPVENIVRVYDGISNVLLRTESVSQTSYTYSLEANANDGGPRRFLRIDVTAKSVTGDESPPASVTVSNPVPPAVIPTITAGISAINVQYASGDNDFAGVQIYVDDSTGFTPGPSNLLYDGPDTQVDVRVTHGRFYVRIAIYDSFGKSGLNLSAEQYVDVTNLEDTLLSVVPDLDAAANAATTFDLEDLAEAVALLAAQIIQNNDDLTGLVARQRQALAVQADGITATVVQETYARIQDGVATAAALLALEATINDDILAAIAEEQTVRADADAAEATAREALSAVVASNAAAILTEATARADGDTAVASTVSALSTTVGDQSATLTTIAESVDGVSVKFGVVGTVDGVTGGFLLTGIEQLDGSVDFTLQIAGDVIIDGSLAAEKLDVEDLSAISANIGEITAGKMRDADSKMVIDLDNQQIIISDDT